MGLFGRKKKEENDNFGIPEAEKIVLKYNFLAEDYPILDELFVSERIQGQSCLENQTIEVPYFGGKTMNKQ